MQMDNSMSSKTNPQFAYTLRNILFLDRVLLERNEKFDRLSKLYIAEHKKNNPKISDKELKLKLQKFTSNFYKHEVDAFGVFSKLKQVRDDMLANQDKYGLTGEQINQANVTHLATLNCQVESGPEGYAAQSLFDPAVIKELKNEYPHLDKQLKSEIAAIADKDFSNLKKTIAYHPATVKLFKQTYPELKNDLHELAKKPNSNQGNIAKYTQAMLKTGSFVANPSGFLVGKALSGILMSDALAPLRNQAAVSIRRASENSGLSDWFKQQCSKLPVDTLKKVAMGTAVAGGVGLVGLGLMDAEHLQPLAESAMEWASELTVPEPVMNSMSIDESMSLYGAQYEVVSSPSVSDVLTDIYKEVAQADPSFAATPNADSYDMLDSLKTVPELDSNIPESLDITAPDGALPDEDNAPSIDSIIQEEPIVAPSVDILPQVDSDVVKSQLDTVDLNESQELVSQPLADTPQPTEDELVEIEQIITKTPVVDSPEVYSVKSGDTLSEIVADKLKEAGVPYDYNVIDDYVDLIASQNEIANKDFIYPGNELDLSSLPVENVKVSSDEALALVESIQTSELKQCTAEFDVALTEGPDVNPIHGAKVDDYDMVGLAHGAEGHLRRGV